MPRPARWKTVSHDDGVEQIDFSSWKYFHDHIRQEMLEFSYYVWRGQREATWGLQTSLDRVLRLKAKAQHASIAKEHLTQFKMAVRGRRGSNPTVLKDEDEWWALAQHNGAATPLLDWTASPFVALYFAFEKEQAPVSGRRVIWAVNAYDPKILQIAAAHKGPTSPPVINIFRPMQDENARLVSQSGLFTRVPYGETVETWIRTHFIGEKKLAPLMKITFPNEGRPDCLRTLNKMNINHLSLFPDVYGAGQHCNKILAIERY